MSISVILDGRRSEAYQQESDSSNDSLHIILIGKQVKVLKRSASNYIPEIRQCLQQGLHSRLIVGLAIIGRQPASGTRVEQSAIRPTIGMDRVN